MLRQLIASSFATGNKPRADRNVQDFAHDKFRRISLGAAGTQPRG
jgi:hypothetical protein